MLKLLFNPTLRPWSNIKQVLVCICILKIVILILHVPNNEFFLYCVIWYGVKLSLLLVFAQNIVSGIYKIHTTP